MSAVFVVEYKDPVAGWIKVSAGEFPDVHAAIKAAHGTYDPAGTRVTAGTQEDLDLFKKKAYPCLECKGALGFECGKLICSECGTEHNYESGEEYLK